MTTPWFWYPIALGVASLLAAEFRVAGLGLTVWIPFGTMLPISVGMVWFLGWSKLEVVNREVRVRGAPSAHVCHRCGRAGRPHIAAGGWPGGRPGRVHFHPAVGGTGAQLWLDDEDDPAPYWVVSTRHPEKFVSVIRAQMVEVDTPEAT